MKKEILFKFIEKEIVFDNSHLHPSIDDKLNNSRSPLLYMMIITFLSLLLLFSFLLVNSANSQLGDIKNNISYCEDLKDWKKTNEKDIILYKLDKELNKW